jgi:hypothetical protein
VKRRETARERNKIVIKSVKVKRKKKKLCLTNSALRHERVWGSSCIDPRILDFGTSWSGQLHASAGLSLGKEPPLPFGYEAELAPEPVWTIWRREKSCPYRDSKYEPAVSRYTDCAIPAFSTNTVKEQMRLRREISIKHYADEMGTWKYYTKKCRV